MKKTTPWILALSWIPQGFFVSYCQAHPDTVRNHYTLGIYPWIQHAREWLLQRIGFSVGDVFYALSFLFVIGWLSKNRKLLFKKPLRSSLHFVGFLALLHAYFLLSWGLNYYQTPLTAIQKTPHTYEEWALESTAEALLQNTKILHTKLVVNDSLAVVFPTAKKSYLNQLNPSPVKASLWSIPLSYMGYAGYLNPFTGEAQVNIAMPTLALITTAAHEQAHQTGIAAENEANFRAYLTTIQHADPHIRYAGYSFAFRYCWAAMYRLNPGCASELAQDIPLGIRKDYKKLQAFWNDHQNPIQPYIDQFYDFFLKANGQTQGTKSYSQVVAFLVQEHLKK